MSNARQYIIKQKGEKGGVTMSQVLSPELQAQELAILVKRGLLREVYRRGGLSQGQFAQLMEQQRGR